MDERSCQSSQRKKRKREQAGVPCEWRAGKGMTKLGGDGGGGGGGEVNMRVLRDQEAQAPPLTSLSARDLKMTLERGSLTLPFHVSEIMPAPLLLVMNIQCIH